MQHFSYFAKAYGGAIYAGLIYLMANIAPEATHISDIPLLVWIGFAASVVGTFAGVAVISNGPKPVPQNADGSYTITNAPAAASAPATSFAATQAKIDALPAVPVAEYVPLDKPAVDPVTPPVA